MPLQIRDFRHGPGAAVMRGHTETDVFGVVDGVSDQRAHMVVFESVEDLRANASGRHESRHTQFRQMLTHRGSRLGQFRGELADGQFAIDQPPQDLHAGGIGQHAECLDHQTQFVGVELARTVAPGLVTCIHTQIVNNGTRWRQGRSGDRSGGRRCRVSAATSAWRL